MKLSKVKVVTANGTFKNANGVDLGNGDKGFFKFEYQMEDGAVLSANHKTTTPFPPGSEVEYEIKGSNDYGSWGRVAKPGSSNRPSGGGKFKGRDNEAILAQFCIREANLYCLHNGYYQGVESDPEKETVAGKIKYVESVARGMAAAMKNVERYIKEDLSD